uniref:Uncharacterized protein n=1 Tax=Picea sitchensis TaxID=3332 RepID=A0A6B9XQR3_PICSI|nr:hypothetical protein Q903MT_gene3941 [Picea sitchensis]
MIIAWIGARSSVSHQIMGNNHRPPIMDGKTPNDSKPFIGVEPSL